MLRGGGSVEPAAGGGGGPSAFDDGAAAFWEICAGAFLLPLCVSEPLLLIGSELDPVVG